MKKSKFIRLVLVTSALASCNKKQDNGWDVAANGGNGERKVYMRSDTSAYYTRAYHDNNNGGYHGFGMYYYAFRPYGMFYNGGYNRVGYYSGGISESSNIGGSEAKASVSRGGFGHSGMGGGE